MDSKDQILWNMRKALGLSGLGNLGTTRQDDLERRLTAAHYRLSPASIVSIYATWLQEQAFREAAMPPLHVVQRWCHYLAGRRCKKEDLLTAWMRAALTVLDKWCAAMAPEKVRDVRQAVYDEIDASWPGELHDTAMGDDATSPAPAPTLQGSLNDFGDGSTNAYSHLASDGVSQSNNSSPLTESVGRYPGYGMVRVTGNTTATQDDELTFEELPPDVYRGKEVKNVCQRCKVKGN